MIINKSKPNFLKIAFISLLGANFSWAAAPQDQVDRLGADLTPFGSDANGNAAGTIPKWDGGLNPGNMPAGYQGAGKHHINPYAGEKPLFVITNANKSKYADKLSEGTKLMLETYSDTFSLPIYKSHRSHAAPDWVYKNTKKNAASAKLANGGNGMVDAYGGYPFPIPSGDDIELQIMWNHINRWRGTYVTAYQKVASVQQNGSYSMSADDVKIHFSFYDPEISAAELNNRLFYYLAVSKEPAASAGGSVLVHEAIDQVNDKRKAWLYNAGQRRVRRAPNITYDTPVTTAEGLYTVDQVDQFNGSPDRYNWKLVHAKPVEMYIPYNSYALSEKGVKYDELIYPGHLNPDLTRYELHRVWVVEGKLKDGARHVYPKRRLYIDEDSWAIVTADHYDSSDQLWRVTISYSKVFYEVPVTFAAVEAWFDLNTRRYVVAGLDSEATKIRNFSQKPPPESFFMPAALRRMGVR